MKYLTGKFASFLFILIVTSLSLALSYPIDGYESTGIRRLLRLDLIMKEEIKETKPVKGAQKLLSEIQLNLLDDRGKNITGLPDPDPDFQKALNSLFPNMHESYSVALLDITPGKEIRYAERQGERGFQPGSVGKLAVAAGLFCELESIYPDSFEQRTELLKNKKVRAMSWAIPNEHTVPFFDPETKKFFKRTLQEGDVFTVYEWVDHMLSVSSNGAASVVWRELILMREFGKDYANLTEQQAIEFFQKAPKKLITEIAMSVVDDPLRSMGITEDEWRLGSLFTRGGKNMAPGTGGSTGSPRGMMKFMIAVEKGEMIDQKSSLEMKRLMYMTDRRIRYAASTALTDAAVYFKSGSLYKCRQESGYSCGKYRGNVDNYMNSVAIVEQPDSTTYLVALMSNVLRKNSNIDHNSLGTRIDKMIRENQ